MKIGDAFPSKYLKAADLGDNKVLVTIDHVATENVGAQGRKETKPVLYFRGKDKGLVLNKTNSRKITTILGTDETDEWKNGRIVLYATETEFAGDMVDCIRVAAPPKNMSVPPPPPPPEEAAEGFDPSDYDVPF